MLNDYEKSCLVNFLQTLEDIHLKRLASSITMGRMNCNARENSISCILLHSESLTSFFNRRKVSPSMLLNYLHRMRVPVAGDATKDTLLEQIFNLWKVPYQPVSSDKQHYTFPSSLMVTSPSNSSTQPTYGDAISTQSLQISNPCHPSGSNNSSYSSLKEMIDTKKMIKEADAAAIDEFVNRFASQFYELLDKPDPGTCYLHSLNSSHFFQKCKMEIIIKGPNEDVEVVDDNCESTLKHLSDLRETHKLLFCPNLSPGAVFSKKNCDGLLCVMVCGTLHHTDGVVGHFQQKFVLSTDPYAQYSYKIKDSKLILTSSQAVPSNAKQMLMSNAEKFNQLAIEPSSNVEIIDVS